MPTQRVLVIEDDAKTAELVRMYLERDGFDVLLAENGEDGLRQALGAPPPDLVVLDGLLPVLDGLEVLRRLRERSRVPVILLTARTTESDRLAGLDGGADDYVPKPFSPRELAARVRAVLRRAPEVDDTVAPLTVGALTIDFARHEVRVREDIAPLTPNEFRLLEVLARSPGRAFTRETLIARAFGADYTGLDRTIDVHVAALRRKLEADPAQPSLIVTVFGVGYRLATPGDAR